MFPANADSLFSSSDKGVTSWRLSLSSVSGNDASRVFNITGAGLTVTLADLAIVHGRASQGGGIDNAGSTLTVFRCLLSNNQVVGVANRDCKGGAIFNEKGATLSVTEST